MGYKYSVAQLQDYYYTTWSNRYKFEQSEAERKHRFVNRAAALREKKMRKLIAMRQSQRIQSTNASVEIHPDRAKVDCNQKGSPELERRISDVRPMIGDEDTSSENNLENNEDSQAAEDQNVQEEEFDANDDGSSSVDQEDSDSNSDDSIEYHDGDFEDQEE